MVILRNKAMTSLGRDHASSTRTRRRNYWKPLGVTAGRFRTSSTGSTRQPRTQSRACGELAAPLGLQIPINHIGKNKSIEAAFLPRRFEKRTSDVDQGTKEARINQPQTAVK